MQVQLDVTNGAAGSAAGSLGDAPGGLTRARPVRPKLGRPLTSAARVLGVLTAAAFALAAIAVLALEVGPFVFPYRTYAIRSGSMQPTLPVGTEIVLRPVRASQLKIGDIITFRRPGSRTELVTHRIVRIEHDGATRAFITKGDASKLPDAWRVSGSGTGWRYAFHIPRAGYLIEGLRLPIVRLGLFGLIALLLGVTALRRIWRPAGQRP